jgi:hypothetical protein
MYSNNGSGWLPRTPPPPRPKSLRHKPFGLKDLPQLSPNARRYIRMMAIDFKSADNKPPR